LIQIPISIVEGENARTLQPPLKKEANDPSSFSNAKKKTTQKRTLSLFQPYNNKQKSL